MTVFQCTGCGAALTTPVSQVAPPAHIDQEHGHPLLGPLLEPGTFTVYPHHHGPPSRPWTETDGAAQGLYAPALALSEGPRGAFVIAPGDLRGSEFIAGRLDGCCCGLDGRDGPNLACMGCGQPVATRIDDCSRWPAVWLEPGAVEAVGGPDPAVSWETMLRERPGRPPVEPDGWWSPVWTAAVGAAVARLLVVADGAPVLVPDGPVAEAFRRTLDGLIPAGPPGRTLSLAGPGLPAAVTDIALVPEHPQTGAVWPADRAVPLAYDVWRYLAFHVNRGPVANSEDPPPMPPPSLFEADRRVLLATLARMPEVRRPELRAIYDRVRSQGYVVAF